MKIERIFSFANKWTFTIKPIRELITYYMANTRPWIDPFAGKYSPAHIRNDINPQSNAEYHLDALDFMGTIENESVAGVLYDPPYSTNQIKVSYQNHGLQSNPTLRTYQAKMKKEINRVLQPNGIVISCGWNTNGCSTRRDRKNQYNQLEMIHILLVPHGTTKNDTLITVERKIQETLI